MPTIAVDFDGVIHGYSKGWQGGVIYDDPVPGAAEALQRLMEKYAVCVFTTRTNLQSVADYIRERLGIPAINDTPGMKIEFWHRQDAIFVTNVKLPATAYIDDRGIRFTSWDQALADLERFES